VPYAVTPFSHVSKEFDPSPNGSVYLVGAGPGDPGLLTLRARDLIAEADAIVYDYLVHPDILQWARPGAELIYVGKKSRQHTLPQGGINQLLVDLANDVKTVVRLKGGDPYVFGRGGEEAHELAEAGIRFEVVPGITSGIAAPAYAGIPVTHRECNTAVAFITGHEDPTKEESTLNWKALAEFSRHGTLVFYMGVEKIKGITDCLIAAGISTDLPVSITQWGTLGKQRSITGTVSTIAKIVIEKGIKPPAITVMGNVNKWRGQLNWFENRPLFGKRIVVTRTRQQASRLSRDLRALGAEVLEIPTIRIETRDLPTEQRKKLENFSHHFNWLVFTSPNGVQYFFEEFDRVHQDIRKLGPVKIAAVGPATAQALAKRNLQCDLTPRTFTTEALAECFSSEIITGKRVCLARSQLANPVLSQHLIQVNALVDEWTVYRTLPETEDPFGKHRDYVENGADLVTFTSSSTVENWHALGLKAPESRCPIHASIGPVTSDTLRKLGMSVDIEAGIHTIPGLVGAIRATLQK